jgi:hypothetical protein
MPGTVPGTPPGPAENVSEVSRATPTGLLELANQDGLQ